MTIFKAILGVTAAILLSAACSDSDGPAKPARGITTIDDLLVRACELAGDCGTSTDAQIEQCPANLLLELDAGDLAELDGFLALSKSTQDSILACFADAVCGRFGGSVLNMSDSDLMDPLRGCP